MEDLRVNAYYWITLIDGESLRTHLVWIDNIHNGVITGSSGGFDNVEFSSDKIVRVENLRDGLIFRAHNNGNARHDDPNALFAGDSEMEPRRGYYQPPF